MIMKKNEEIMSHRAHQSKIFTVVRLKPLPEADLGMLPPLIKKKSEVFYTIMKDSIIGGLQK